MDFMIQGEFCIDALATLRIEARLLDPDINDFAAAKAIQGAMTDDNGHKRYVPCELFIKVGGDNG